MRHRWLWFLLAVTPMIAQVAPDRAVAAEPGKIDTLQAMYERIGKCWKSPKLPEGDPGMQITVLFTLTRTGELFGKPKITFESPEASEADSIAYRIAVMETLQRCTPMPFTDSMGGAAAGHPIRFRFDDRRNIPRERKA
jgi:hypothetical protein